MTCGADRVGNVCLEGRGGGSRAAGDGGESAGWKGEKEVKVDKE